MDGQENRRVAIVTHRLNVYSETFIHAQIELLPADIVLHNGRMPSMVGNKFILSNARKEINKLTKIFFKTELFALANAISHLLKKERIDVVLAQYGPVGVSFLPLCIKLEIPLVVHFHGFDASHFETLRKNAEGYKSLFKYAKAIIVVSEKMAAQLLTLGCPPEKLILNHYGVNSFFYSTKPDFASDTFLAVGRFVEKKGPEFTIRAFAKLVDRYPQAQLFMTGDGPLLAHCKLLVQELAMTKNIFFPGILKHEMVAGFMQKSIAFVQHSIVASTGDSEGTPVAIMEASAAALPVIATRHAGIPDVILDGVTGLLVPEKDIDQMADAMLKLILNKSLAKSMGEAGRERMKTHFSMERYIKVLRNALEA